MNHQAYALVHARNFNNSVYCYVYSTWHTMWMHVLHTECTQTFSTRIIGCRLFNGMVHALDGVIFNLNFTLFVQNKILYLEIVAFPVLSLPFRIFAWYLFETKFRYAILFCSVNFKFPKQPYSISMYQRARRTDRHQLNKLIEYSYEQNWIKKLSACCILSNTF